MKEKHKTLAFFGMLFLVLAMLSLRYLHLAPHLSADAADGASGVLMGLAIGLNLCAVAVKARGLRC